MRWLDVAGAPASGKSTLCDQGCPRKVEPDGLPYPIAWGEFMRRARGLISSIEAPGSALECWTILERYVEKIATVSRRDGGVYVNTGLAQAGLEIAWRVPRVEICADYFRLMPVSLGVAFLWADEATLVQRNRVRKRDRSHMVAGMERGREVANRALASRGVRVLNLDTRDAIPINAEKLRGLTWTA